MLEAFTWRRCANPSMRDLKDELASLKIDREPAKPRRWGLLDFRVVAAGGSVCCGLLLRKQQADAGELHRR